MGCIVDKVPDCLQLSSTIIETRRIPSSIEDCYREIQFSYEIRESLTPFLKFSQFYVKPGFCEEIKEKDFLVFFYSCEQLVDFSVEMFKDSGLDLAKIGSLMDVVSKNYYFDVPFHNFWHGFSVMQMIYVIGERNSKFERFLRKEEYWYLLIGAAGHDICHVGVNNGYLISTNHALVKQYGKVSVLENHHSAVILEIIRLSNVFPEKNLQKIRKNILEAILSTDMAKHNQCCSEFSESIQNYNIENESQRQKFMNYLLHCCDLGNQTLDFSLASIWSLKVIQEFNHQVACETREKVKVSQFMDIGNNFSKIKNSQIGFISAIIHPIWKTLSENLENIEDFPETVEKNKKKWKKLERLI